jgi:hypothetical protein
MTPKLWAYEMDWFGADSTSWEIWDESNGDKPVCTVESDDFGQWLDSARCLGYDVLINTLESWEAMTCS